MSKRRFTKEEIEELLKNENFVGCSEKSISYKKEFKVMAVKQYQEGLSPSSIFKQAGINVALIGNKTPRWCLARWLKIFNKTGEVGLKIDGRRENNPNGRPKTNWQNEKEKIKYLETQIAYLKAENDFLARLRKKS